MRNKFRWLTIALHNWGYFIRTLVIQAIIIAILVGICSVFIPPLIVAVLEIIEQLNLTEFVEEFLAIYNAGVFSTGDLAQLLADKIDEVYDVLLTMPAMWEFFESSLAVFLVLLCGYRMLISLPDVPTVCCIDEFMSSNSRRPVIWYYAKKVGTTLKFCLLQFLVAFPLDLVVLFATVGFALIFAMFWGVGSMYLAIVVGIVLYSIRYTMLAFWLPSIVVDNMGVHNALSNNFAVLSKCFWSLFFRNAIVVTLIFVGSLLINSYFLLDVVATIINTVVVLLLFYVIKCINITAYYEATGRSYFSNKVPRVELECSNNTNK